MGPAVEPYCPIHERYSDLGCGADCADARAAFRRAQHALAQFFSEQYGQHADAFDRRLKHVREITWQVVWVMCFECQADFPLFHARRPRERTFCCPNHKKRFHSRLWRKRQEAAA